MTKTPPEIVAKFDAAAPRDPRVVRKLMFGYPALFIGGNMFGGTFRDDIVVRLPAERVDRVIKTGKGTQFADGRAPDDRLRRAARERRREASNARGVDRRGARLCRDAAHEEKNDEDDGDQEADATPWIRQSHMEAVNGSPSWLKTDVDAERNAVVVCKGNARLRAGRRHHQGAQRKSPR